MQTTLTKALGSSYLVNIISTQDEMDGFNKKALEWLQGEVKVQWFRPGHVPLHMVEKQIKPEYLEMAIVEEIINESIKSIVKDHANIQFIGQPYEITPEDKDGGKVISYKLDVYPEVTVKNANWEKLSIEPMDTFITKEDTEKAIQNLQRQYADYKEAEMIIEDSLVKASYSMVDKDWKELHKGSAFLGKEEYDESPILWDALKGKKKTDLAEIPYEEEKLPHAVHYHPHGSELAKQITKVILTIVDIKETILPDLNDEATLTRLFQSSDIKTYDGLVDKVKSVLIEQKEENGLQTAVEKLLSDAKDSFAVEVPETFVREEMSARIKQLGEKFGGEEGLKQYLAKIGEEKTNQMYDEMRTSAKESLEKFFILRKFVELLGIENISWENHLDAERKIYAKLSNPKDAVAWNKEEKKDEKPTKTKKAERTEE